MSSIVMLGPKINILRTHNPRLCAFERASSVNEVDGITRCPPVPVSVPGPPRGTGPRNGTHCTESILPASRISPSVHNHAGHIYRMMERILSRRSLQIGYGLRGVFSLRRGWSPWFLVFLRCKLIFQSLAWGDHREGFSISKAQASLFLLDPFHCLLQSSKYGNLFRALRIYVS